MAAKPGGVLDAEDLNDADKKILDKLHGGRGTPQYIADGLGTDRSYVNQRLTRLVEHEHVAKLAPGLYEVVDDPRDDAEPTDTESRVATLEAELQKCRESLRRERSADRARLDDQSIRRLKNALSAAHSALEGSHPSVDQARAEIEAAQEVLQDDER